ncbi:MAG: Nif3-like dinuclear metal center hexameric protein, partial [Clostridia bacterium]|nr:Nif3-like dinuclear metal center hexameric protein [Clostridia bacterium]
MTVKQIFEFLDSKFPISTACDFDNVGILVGDSNAKVNKALLSLDCTLDTVKKAVDSECQLIITHHPVIFSPLKSVLNGSIVYELIRNNIAVISMHTNLDVGLGGVNTCLC